MLVEPATPSHLDDIRAAYANGRAHQAAQHAPVWPEFTDRSILDEIEAGRLFRVTSEDEFVGVFSIAYEDPAIWGERERGAHIYLHRVARAATSPTRGLFDAVLRWSFAKCEVLGREGVRMDTWGDNAPLIAYYQSLGFTLLDKRRIPKDQRLPDAYYGLELALLERPLKSVTPRATP